jgi:hypothetical protein
MLYQLSYTPTGSPAKVVLSWVPYGHRELATAMRPRNLEDSANHR